MPFETFFSGRLKVKVTKVKMVINGACPGHNLYIYAWISKLYGTVVLEEEKCHLKHFFQVG